MGTAKAQTLAAGDIAFIGVNEEPGPDGGKDHSFTWIALKAIPAGEEIFFTEQGWNKNASGTPQGYWMSNSESHFKWTSPAGGIPVGTIIHIYSTPPTNTTLNVEGGGVASALLSGSIWNLNAGDQVVAYQSSGGAKPDGVVPTFLSAIHMDDNQGVSTGYDPITGWTKSDIGASEGSASASHVPPGLTNGVNCIALFNPSNPEAKNARYIGSLVGTVAEVRSRINSPSFQIPSYWGVSGVSAAFNITPGTYTVNIAIGSPATLTTTAATNVGAVKATLGGNVTADGGASVTEHGIVWGIAANPSTANNKVIMGAGTGSFSSLVSGLPAGTTIHFRAYAINGAGTSYGVDESFTTTAALNTSSTSKTDLLCNGGTTGSASVTVIGGKTPYSYSWSPSGGTGATASGLSAGNYTCSITDAEGTQITRSFTIIQPSAFTVGTSQTNVSCNGGSNGTATVSVTGGTPGYSYSWAPSGGTGPMASGLAVGVYTVTITDANLCQTTRQFTITQPPAFTVGTSQTNVSCNGGSNGTATVSVSGATSPYTYSWAPSGGTGATASGLAAGVYTVTITDNNSCQTTREFTIAQPTTALGGTITKTDVSCNGGSNGTATVSITGGTTPYTYSWSPSGGTAATATGLAANTYTCTITDFNGCQITRSITINQPATALSVATGGGKTDVSCNGGNNGTATVAPTGGTMPYSYSWSPSGGTNATATGLAAGTYTVTVTDFNGCQSTRNFTINQPATALSASTGGGKTDVSCNGGSNGTATVAPTGGTMPYSYSWSPSGGTNATATGLAAGTYTVTVTDFNGCQTTRSFTVNQPATALTAIPSSTDVSCNGGSNGTATVTPSGGTPSYTYSWAPSGGTAATATGLAAGTYTCTITDANACQITRTVTISQPATAITVTPVAQTNIACNGGATGAATVEVTGGTPNYTYSWSPSGGTAATAIGLTAGTYTVTVTDANGCIGQQSFTITQPTAMVLTPSQTNVSCNGGANGSASVAVTGGTPSYTYSWAPSGGTNATAMGLVAGTYVVTVTDANGCEKTQSFTIGQPTAMVLTPSQTNVSCNGGTNGSASVAVTGGTPGYTYSWAPMGGTAATATGLPAGNYTVTVTDANNCSTTQDFSITQPTALVATADGQTNVSCSGGTNGSATVAVTGGTGTYTYSWAPTGGTAATASGLTAGTYTVTVTDANSCQTTQSFTITEPTALVATAAAQTNIACNGAATGSATVAVTGGTGAYTYAWAPSGGTAATASGLAAGTYTVTVTDANGCTATESFTLTQPTALVATASAQTNLSCNGGANGSATVAVTGGTPGYTYSWAPSGGTSANATGLTAGTYTVTVTDANGCTATQSFTLTQPAPFVVTPSQTNVSCNGGANGSAEVSVTGGTGTYTYSWAPSGGTSAAAYGLAAGTYTVTIKDANLCQTTQSFTITQPAALIATSAGQTDVSCNGGNDGTATVAVTGGTGLYTYSWAPMGGTAATATGLTAGTYTVTVTDANGCTGTQSFTISEASASITVATADVEDVTVETAKVGGNVGNTTCVTEKGVVFGTSLTPTLLDNKVISASVGAEFQIQLTNLAANTTYYFRAYAIINGVVSYGDTKTFMTVKNEQQINFQPIAAKTYGEGSFILGDLNTDRGLPITYTASIPGIVQIVGNQATIVGAGTTMIVATQAGDQTNNEATPVQQSLTVAKASLTVTADAKTKMYGTTDPLLTYVVKLTDLKNGDAATVVAGSLERTAGQDVGAYVIQNKNLTATNYTINFIGADLIITKAPLTVTADAKVKVYGEVDPALTYVVKPTDLRNGDAATVVTGGLERVSGQNIGNYAINNKNLTATNYTINYVGAELTITKASLTVTAEAKTKVYGAADPALTYVVKNTDLKNGDVATVVTGDLERVVGQDVGNYAINNKNLTAANYAISYVGADLTITKATLTVTADAKTKVYGAVDPALTYVVKASDLKNGDVATVVTGDLERVVGQNVGTYAVKNKNLTASNYAINYVGADLTVTKAALTVTADPKTKVYGTNDPALTYVVKASDLKYTDDATVVTGSLERVAGTNVGTYAINNKNLAATNYAISYVGDNLSITRATLTGLTFVNKDFVYDGATKSLQLGGTLPAGVAVVYQNNDKINAGSYEVTANIVETQNYFGTSLKANLLIRKATQTITFTAPEVLRRDVGKVALDVKSNSGLAVTLSVDDPMVATVSGTDLEVLRLGTVRITASQAGNENYEPATAVTEVIRVANEELVELPIIVHQAVSPNGDGENEFLIIEAIRDYPDNRVTIFDKNGVVLSEIVGYDNNTKVFWGLGHHDGTYFYYIDLKDGNTWRRVKGFFLIKR